MNNNNMITRIASCILFILAVTISQAICQNSSGAYFRFDTSIDLPSPQKIQLLALGNKELDLSPSNEIRLIPSDMAQLSPARILSCQTDTLPSNSGPRECTSNCVLDTLFITQELFLINPTVITHFFEDGTFTGESSFGMQVLDQLGNSSSLNGPTQIEIQSVHPENTSPASRLRHLTKTNLTGFPGFPFNEGDIDEVRFVKCNLNPETESQIDFVVNMLQLQNVFCSTTSIDPLVPPSTAVNRIQSPVTIRFFEAAHAERASILGESIAYLLNLPITDIYVEDMLPAYGGVTPVQDYIEVWFL